MTYISISMCHGLFYVRWFVCFLTLVGLLTNTGMPFLLQVYFRSCFSIYFHICFLLYIISIKHSYVEKWNNIQFPNFLCVYIMMQWDFCTFTCVQNIIHTNLSNRLAFHCWFLLHYYKLYVSWCLCITNMTLCTHTQHFSRKKIWLSFTVCHWWSMNCLYFRRYLHFQWGINFLSSVPFSYSHNIIYPSICGISLSFLHFQIILTFCVYCIISWLTQLTCLLSLRKCYVNGCHHNKNPT